MNKQRLTFYNVTQPHTRGLRSSIDRLTYAIGDIHGRQDLFIRLLERIQTDSETLELRPRIVLLGDYIDRGPASSAVMETIVELARQPWCDLEILLGNHEFFLVRFMIEPQSGETWLDYGGLETLQSYGIRPPRDHNDLDQWVALRDKMLKIVPRDHLKILYGAKIHLIAGDYLFVHAGVMPGVALDQQGPDTLLWIRNEFLEADKSCEYVVVHGHSITSKVENLPWRIGVDTGAYRSDILSAVRLNGAGRHFLQVGAQSSSH